MGTEEINADVSQQHGIKRYIRRRQKGARVKRLNAFYFIKKTTAT
jgi:hypothetical protein